MTEQNGNLHNALAVALEPPAPGCATQVVPLQMRDACPSDGSGKPLVHLNVTSPRLRIRQYVFAARQLIERHARPFRQWDRSCAAALGLGRGNDQSSIEIDLVPAEREHFFAAE